MTLVIFVRGISFFLPLGPKKNITCEEVIPFSRRCLVGYQYLCKHCSHACKNRQRVEKVYMFFISVVLTPRGKMWESSSLWNG